MCGIQCKCSFDAIATMTLSIQPISCDKSQSGMNELRIRSHITSFKAKAKISSSVYGLFTPCNCDCIFVIENNAFYGIQCKCSRDAIATMTLNPQEPISCEKQITATVASPESKSEHFLQRVKGLFTRCNCNCDFFIATNGLYMIQCKCSHGATSTIGCSHNLTCAFSFATNGLYMIQYKWCDCSNDTKTHTAY